MLPPLDDMDELYTLPVFLVPSTTQEPIDLRFVSDTDACIALNQQRHKDTAILVWTLSEERQRAGLAGRKHLNGLRFKFAERRKRD